MRQDNLSHTLHVRVSPALRDALVVAADREDITSGEYVRRAIQVDLEGSSERALDPFADLSYAVKEDQLCEAIRAVGCPGKVQLLTEAIGDRLVDLMDSTSQALNVIHDEDAHQRFERASGYLRQASEFLLDAAFRVKAIRVNQGIANGDLERLLEIQARQAGEGC